MYKYLEYLFDIFFMESFFPHDCTRCWPMALGGKTAAESTSLEIFQTVSIFVKLFSINNKSLRFTQLGQQWLARVQTSDPKECDSGMPVLEINRCGLIFVAGAPLLT